MKKAVICGIPIFGGFTIPASVPLIGGLGPAGFPAVCPRRAAACDSVRSLLTLLDNLAVW